MCGIIGYYGTNGNAVKVILDGLIKLEYRGYDSAGISYLSNSNELKIDKSIGSIDNLIRKVDKHIKSNLGLGHTRWATHGEVNTDNCHPHNVGSITLVHNGVIENYLEIKKHLQNKGYQFNSTTDTEVSCALIDSLYNDTKDIVEALYQATNVLIGSFAFGIIVRGIKKLYAMKRNSPLVINHNNNEGFIASDTSVLAPHTDSYILLEDNDIAEIDPIITIFHHKKQVNRISRPIINTDEIEDKGNFDYFMLKEIYEEPTIIEKTICNFTKNHFDLTRYNHIDIVACGSSYHVGLLVKYWIEQLLNISTNVEIASEYRYKKLIVQDNSLTIIISQSGETADSLAAIKIAKILKIPTLAIVNVIDSSIAREADNIIYTKAGKEVSVATTKAYIAQLLSMALLIENNKALFEGLPKELSHIIDNKMEDITQFAYQLYQSEHIYFLGRGVDYAIAMEGALKIKEISYIHCEAYAAGEIKHGTIALIEKNTPVIAIVTDNNIREKTISNMKEVSSRGANVLAITNEDILDFNNKIIVNKLPMIIQPFNIILILQLLAFQIAKLKGCSIDKPKNLAKSVTVE
ncbi:MAG: glutamine--fructose-6-phosphate transaminase (isomerizing) [Candidatus Azobacteroides pseudotrichonymphae]|jgi:glucosamine--fructose-6-phosphate aminotransferase (isomerizing)|nr:glutamine--fructose-6-phosphate transaminase (isomerizing) [Bacteroidales bacterium OttesenSCG-928-I14]GMO35202.1 MAG: glutamine--fructose-6-phosphate transaminase (isomerizing) [Candidatus Azobacteroides pseudotrichonymphae]